ncbi:hypothetical protein GYMLUDRAFT_166832, partial [Collybiopsis luxurians FD-317 M1]
ALVRDGYQCVVTRMIDPKCTSFFDAAQRKTFGTGATRCAHIVPESALFGLDKELKKEYSASILAVLDRFGIKGDDLNGENIHGLWNVMTLALQIHDSFDKLELWLEATVSTELSHYSLTTFSLLFVLRKKEHEYILTLSDLNVPLPNPKLLEFHAAVCKIAHLSGAAERIENVMRDYERIGVLAEDGGSMAILEQALLRAGSNRIGT